MLQTSVLPLSSGDTYVQVSADMNTEAKVTQLYKQFARNLANNSHRTDLLPSHHLPNSLELAKITDLLHLL
jgi:hypothetical protein